MDTLPTVDPAAMRSAILGLRLLAELPPSPSAPTG
jgi:hypothetical protein